MRTGDHEGELTEAPALLAALPLTGRVVTGDALYCQRALCDQIRAAGGDYLVLVKENQPTLLGDIRTLFDEPPPREVFGHAAQAGAGHGRREERRLWASMALATYLEWPGVQQVGKVTRTVTHRGRTSGETRYFVTSLGPAADPDRLLALVRGHRRIENRLHYVRDVTLGEDASRVRSGAAPHVMSIVRNAVLTLLRAAACHNVAASLRAIGWLGSALAVLGLRPREN